ncbi:hypothetical protein [Bradyrhizobium sp. AUGA SZCCT0182]|uniref:hypothetical protein n=1 Tax=Bradyrhizobium sp. AUGA SZCCT0182 TaxID=2807667 RepID=UPI001BAC6CA9|nr:hypothetical protein [Bradyrhizobium sp. AUGA SZCCT0182]MBR1231674.1 hypothetical protein [Bradyrhizobium sp. AUGA SZCCT0182]
MEVTNALAPHLQGLWLVRATDEDGITPLLVVWHPLLKRHFSGDDAWKRAVRLSVHSPES